jgi:hypothetical protein
MHYRFGYMGDYFQVKISKMDWLDSSRIHAPNINEEKKIKEVISDFYFNECQGDSLESDFKLRDTYLTTIYYYNRPFGVYMVLLKHPLMSGLQSRIFLRFGDSLLKDVVDFNLHGLYNVNKGHIESTNLHQEFSFIQPEVQITVPKPGAAATAVRLQRLYHNGTANAKEVLIIGTDYHLKLDTVYFQRDYNI